jgi:hypothetical protein
MTTVDNTRTKKPRNMIIPLLILIGLFLLLIIYELDKPAATQVGAATSTASTPSPSGSPTCPVNMQLSTPIGVDTTTRLIVILYDAWAQVNPGLDLTNGERISDIPVFVSKIIPDILGPGDEISVFQLGYASYTAARVTRQYSYLTIYPQLYVAPSLTTLTPLPPTGEPTAGFGEVATKNAARILATERAAAEAANNANYNCQVQYYNENIRSTATVWDEMVKMDVNGISTAAASDFGEVVTPSRGTSEELLYGGLYYGLYFASVDIKADCAKYDECDLVIVDDLHVWRKNNPDRLPIALNGVNLYVIMPGCRDINQPDCADLQSYWTTQFEGFGVSKLLIWNGVRAELNLLGEIGR